MRREGLMKLGSNDLAVIGLCLAIAGSFLLSKSIISKDMFMIEKESGTYFNKNMYQLKGSIFQRYESLIGGFYLILGFACNLVGVFISVKSQNKEDIFLYSYWNILFFILLSVLLAWGGISISRRLSFDKYTPIVKTVENIKTLKWALFILENDGWYPEEYEKKDKLNPSPDTLQAHLAQAKNIVANMALWLDITRDLKEDDIQFTNKIISIYEGRKR